MNAYFPNSVWDGTSISTSVYDDKSPSPKDRSQANAEIIALQNYVLANSVDPGDLTAIEADIDALEATVSSLTTIVNAIDLTPYALKGSNNNFSVSQTFGVNVTVTGSCTVTTNLTVSSGALTVTTGNLTITNGQLVASKGFIGVFANTTISSSQNNWAPTAVRNTRLTVSNSSLSITGMSPSVFDGEERNFYVLTNSVTIVHQSGSSTTKFFCSGAANIVVPVGGRFKCIWDNTSSVWRVI